MHYDITKQIPPLFGLNHFDAGPKITIDETAPGNFTIDFIVDLLWAAKIYYYEYPLVVAVMHVEAERKGVLIDIAGITKKHSMVVDLKDWDDPVQRALQSVNLAPSPGVASVGSLKMYIRTELIDSEVYMPISNMERNLDSLTKAVLEVTGKIAMLYGGSDWQDLFQTRTGFE